VCLGSRQPSLWQSVMGGDGFRDAALIYLRLCG